MVGDPMDSPDPSGETTYCFVSSRLAENPAGTNYFAGMRNQRAQPV